MTFRVGDRVRCISKDFNAPVGIVGTVVSTEGAIVRHQHETEFFPYIVKWDTGQNHLVDLLFPNGAPELEDGMELIGEAY